MEPAFAWFAIAPSVGRMRYLAWSSSFPPLVGCNLVRRCCSRSLPVCVELVSKGKRAWRNGSFVRAFSWWKKGSFSSRRELFAFRRESLRLSGGGGGAARVRLFSSNPERATPCFPYPESNSS